jgi:parallel beta-helix repeat protein
MKLALLILSAALFTIGSLPLSMAQTFDLQAEVDRAIAAGGGEVIVPPGVHTVARTVVVKDALNLVIVGYDRDGSVLKLQTNDKTALPLLEVQGKSQAVRLRKLTLEGGIWVHGSYHEETGPTGPQPKDIEINDCIFRNCPGQGITFTSAEQCKVHACTIMDTQDVAIRLKHFSQNITVTDNHIARCRVGVELTDTNDCTVAYNEIRQCETGLHLRQQSKLPKLNQNNKLVGNAFTKMSGNDIKRD